MSDPICRTANELMKSTKKLSEAIHRAYTVLHPIIMDNDKLDPALFDQDFHQKLQYFLSQQMNQDMFPSRFTEAISIGKSFHNFQHSH